MDPEVLQLAIAYSELANSIAWQDFMKMQVGESERLELEALNAPATDFEACRSAIIAWQQHRRVIRAMEEFVKDAVKSQQQEILDERIDRGSRANW